VTNINFGIRWYNKIWHWLLPVLVYKDGPDRCDTAVAAILRKGMCFSNWYKERSFLFFVLLGKTKNKREK
jgi:hypothetical protein